MPNQQSNLNQQFNQPTQPISSPPAKPKFNLKYILIVLVLVTAVSGVILAYKYWWLPKQEIKPPEITIKDKTASWQTYRNEEWGFEVKHPPEWFLKYYPNCEIREDSLPRTDCLEMVMIQNMENVFGISGYLGGSSVFIVEIFTDNSSSIEEWVAKISSGYEESIREEQKKKMLNEIKTIKIGGEENRVWWNNGMSQETIYFLRNGRGYQITYFSYSIGQFNQHKEIFDQIISTFKFIK